MQPIIELAKELAALRKQITDLEEATKPLKQAKDLIQSKLIESMREIELKSIKTDDFNFARTTKKDFKVVNEDQVIEELRKRNEYENYVKPKIDLLGLKSYANSLLKGTGEILDGMEPTETEYMSIKSNAKEN